MKTLWNVLVIEYFLHAAFDLVSGKANGLQLRTVNPDIVPGSTLTLVCSWDDNIHPNISWSRGVDPFNVGHCRAEDGKNTNTTVSVNYGYKFQSITIRDMYDHDVDDEWCCIMNSILSTSVRINSTNTSVILSIDVDVVYIGSTFTLTCSVSDDAELSLAYWFSDHQQNHYMYIGESCKNQYNLEFKGPVNISSRSRPDCSENKSISVTVVNVTKTDEVTWSCKVAGQGSNLISVIVVDTPDWPKMASITQEDKGNNSSLVLTCSSQCLHSYSFHWDLGELQENTSGLDYDRCKQVCSQSVTLRPRDKAVTVMCHVKNEKTGKTASAEYRVDARDANTTRQLKKNRPRDVGPVVGGAVAATVAVVSVVIVVCVVKRRRSLNLHPEPVNSEVCASKDLKCTAEKEEMVMIKNIVYESADEHLIPNPEPSRLNGDTSKKEVVL